MHAINEETADDVRSWQTNAQAVQDDIARSKALANEILRAAEAPAVSGKAVREVEAKAEFLRRELNYNRQVQEALRGIKAVNQTLDQVEQACGDRRILDALHLLESERSVRSYVTGRSFADCFLESWREIDAILSSKACRAIKLLDIRAFELKSDVHEAFDHVWRRLIHVDVDNHRVTISSAKGGRRIVHQNHAQASS